MSVMASQTTGNVYVCSTAFSANNTDNNETELLELSKGNHQWPVIHLTKKNNNCKAFWCYTIIRLKFSV